MTGRSRARDRSRPGNGGSALWTPLALAPQLWLRGDLGVTGSPVSAWADQSGNARHALQGVGANQPAAPTSDANFAGKMTLAFDSTDIMGTTAAPSLDVSAAWTLVAVSRIDTLINFNGLLRLSTSETGGAGAADGVVLYTGGTGTVVIASPNASTWFKQSAAGAAAAGVSYVWLASCSGTGVSVSVERGTISGGTITWATVIAAGGAPSGTFGMPSASGIFAYPGGGWTSGTSRLQGSLAEQIAWGRTLSAGELAQLKSYLLRYA